MNKLLEILKNKFGDKALINFLESLYNRYDQHGVSEMGAQLTYYLVLSIFPFIIFILNIIRVSPLSDIDVLERILSNLPDESKKILIDIINGIIAKSSYALLSMGAIGGLWSASNGIMSLIKSVNRAYDLVEDRPYWKLRLLAIILTLTFSIILVFSIGVLVFGELAFKTIFISYTWSSYVIWKILQFLISILLIGLLLTILYKMSPSIKEGIEIKFRDSIPGGIFSSIGLILSSTVFSFYVNNFGKYSNTYGSIGGIIVLLIWLYISSTIIVLGAEVNAVRISSRDMIEI